MRKEIVYSLAAVAAFPVVASAAESGVSYKTLVAGSGQELLLTDEAGVQIEAGRYQLNFASISGGSRIDFKFFKKQTNGEFSEVTLKDGDEAILNRVSLLNKNTPVFDLEEGVYQIRLYNIVATTEGITAGGPTLVLVFDFQNAATVLKDLLKTETNTITGVEGVYPGYRDPRCTGDASKLNDVAGVIDSIGMVNYQAQYDTLPEAKKADFQKAFYKSTLNQDKVNAQGYELYQKYELFNIEDEEAKDSVTKAIEKIADEARAHEAEYMQAAVTDLRGKLDTLKNGALKDNLAAALTNIEKADGSLRDFAGKGETTSPEVWEEIDQATDAVTKALAMDAFYEETVLPYIDAVQKAKNAANDSIVKLAVGNDSTGVQTKSQAAFTAIQTELDKVKTSIENAYQAGNLGSATEAKWIAANNKGLKDSLDRIWRAGTEGTPAVYYTREEYNTQFAANYETDEAYISNVDEDARIKTPAVDAAPAGGLVVDTLKKYSELALYLQHADSVVTENRDSLTKFNVLKEIYGAKEGGFLSLSYQKKKYNAVLNATDAQGEPLNLVDPEDLAEWEAGVNEAVTDLVDAVEEAAKVKGPVSEDDLNDLVDEIEAALAGDAKWDKYAEMLDTLDKLKVKLDTTIAKLDTFSLKRINDAQYLQKYNKELTYDFTPAENLSNDDDDAYRTSPRLAENVYFSDSINAEIDTLKKYLADYVTTGENPTINETFWNKVKAIGGDVENNVPGAIETMVEKMAEAADKFVKTQQTIDSLYDELAAIKTRAIANHLYNEKYPMTVGEGDAATTVYIGGYKAKIDSIMGNVRKEGDLDRIWAYNWTKEPTPGMDYANLGNGIATIQALLDTALVTTGISKVDEITVGKNDSTFNDWMSKIKAFETVQQQANLSDTTLIRECIDLLKDNIEGDSAIIGELADLAAFDNLKKTVRDLADSLNTMITRIEGAPAVEGQDEELYGEDGAKEYNASLDDALEPKEGMSADEAANINQALETDQYSEGDPLTEDLAAQYNATLPGAKTADDVKTPAVPNQPAIVSEITKLGLLDFDKNEILGMIKTVKDSLAKIEKTGEIPTVEEEIYPTGVDYNVKGSFYTAVSQGDTARAAKAMPYSETLYNQLGLDAAKLRDLVDIMEQVKEYITNALAIRDANRKALAALNKQFDGFLQDIRDAKNLVGVTTDELKAECEEVYDLPETPEGDNDKNIGLKAAKDWYDNALGGCAAANDEPVGTDEPVGPDEPAPSRRFAPDPLQVEEATPISVRNIPTEATGEGDDAKTALENATDASVEYPEGSIMEAFQKLVQDAKAACENGTLATLESVDDSYATALVELRAELTEVVNALKDKQKSLSNLLFLETLDETVQEAKDEAGERLISVEGQLEEGAPTAVPHYQGEIEKIMLSYQGKTPLVEGEGTDAVWSRGEAEDEKEDSIGFMDKAYGDYVGDTLLSTNNKRKEYLDDIMNVVNDLDEIYARALSNKNNYAVKMPADTTRVLTAMRNSLDAADEYDTNFADQNPKPNYKAQVNALIAELQALDVDSMYENGGLENDSLVADGTGTKWQKDVLDIKQRFEALQNIFDAANVEARMDDKVVMSEIGDKAEETRGVYQAAVSVDKAYLTLRSQTLRGAVEQAKRESQDYNDFLKEYPYIINHTQDSLVTLVEDFRTAAGDENVKYDRETLADNLEAFDEIQEEIITKQTEFANKFSAVITSAVTAYFNEVERVLGDSAYVYAEIDGVANDNNFVHFDTTKAGIDNSRKAVLDFIAELKDALSGAKASYDALDETAATIKKLDDMLHALEVWNPGNKSYDKVLDDKLANRAVVDLKAGFAVATEIIRKGNQNYYGQASTIGVPEEELNTEWEDKKETIRGTWPIEVAEQGVPEYIDIPVHFEPLGARRAVNEDVEEENINPGLGYIIYNNINAENYKEKYDSIYTILSTFINDESVKLAVANQDAYDELMYGINGEGNAKSLQKQLNDSIAAHSDQTSATGTQKSGYVVIKDMVYNGGYKTAQTMIDALTEQVQAAYEAGVAYNFDATEDSTIISRLINIASTMIGDTITGDTAVSANILPENQTLFRKEQAYLEDMESVLWSLFNKAASNLFGNISDDTQRETTGKLHEKTIQDIYKDLETIVADAVRLKTPGVPADDAAKLLPLQNKVEAEIAALLQAAADSAAFMVDSTREALKAELNKVAEKLQAIDGGDYPGLTQEQITAISGEFAELGNKVENLSDKIVNAQAKDILFKEKQYKDEIAELDKETNALKAEIEALDAKNDRLKENNDSAKALVNDLSDLGKALQKMEDAFDEFENLDNDYSNRRSLINERANALRQEVEDALGELIDNNAVEREANTLIADINALVKTAAQEDIRNIAEDLEERANDIDLDEDDFVASDYQSLNAALTSIKNDIHRTTGMGWFQQQYGLVADANNSAVDYDIAPSTYDYETLKDRAEKIEARIDSLLDKINTLNGGGDLPPVVLLPGDIDGDGFVTSDDVEEFLDDLLEGDLPERNTAMFIIYDVNEDGLINIADAQGIQNLSLGLNVDGSVPDVLAARSTEALSGSVTAESTQLQNGAQRIVLTLNGNFDWTGFQLDVKGAEVLSESAAITLKSAEKNGTHRIVAFGSKQGNGQVITLDVQGNAKLGTITFTTPDAQAVSFKLSGTTGIYGISTESNNIFYDLSGKLVKGMKKGVNIIRDAAGKAKKAIMK